MTAYTLGVDLDDSTADYLGGLRNFLADNGVPEAVDFPAPTVYDLNYADGWHFGKFGDFIGAHTAAVTAGMFSSLEPLDGALEGLHALSDAGVRIHVITHRILPGIDSSAAVLGTVQWLSRHDFPHQELSFSGRKERIKVDALIDDSPSNILAGRNAGNKVLAFSQEHNSHIKGDRVHSWTSDVVSTVLAHRESVLG